MKITSRLSSGLCLLFVVLGSVQLDGQEQRRPLDRTDYKDGRTTLGLFAPVVKEARSHIVQLEHEGQPLVLGTIVAESGSVITKASEVQNQTFTAKLADGRSVPARLVAVDDLNDVGLVQVNATDLSPVEWTTQEAPVGQWAVTPGIDPSPEAVGIISVAPRRIQHKRAFIGVELDFRTPQATIVRLLRGMGAEAAGLQPGDVVLALNGVPIKNSQELAQELRAYRGGEIVALQIERNDGQFEASVHMKVPEPDPEQRRLDREERMNRMGSELSARAEGFQQAIQHDTVLQSWQCGGPLLNLDGQAIGLNIARAGRVATYALPAALVEEILQTLQAKATQR